MNFNFGNLVSAAVGAVSKVANTVVKGGGFFGGIAGAFTEIAKAAIGAVTAVANVSEDGEFDEDDIEEILANVFKVLVGATMAMFGSGSSDSTRSDINGEKMVISGNKTGNYHPRMFIETAIKQIKDWKAENNNDVTWVVVESGYTNTDKNLMKMVARDNDVNLMFINDRDELINYINTGKDKEGNIIEDRSVNKITDVSIFSHGLRDDGGILALNYEDGGNLNISSDELKEIYINKEAFSNLHTYFASCNAGTVVNETSFASEWVSKVGGEAEAICDPTPDSEEKGGQTSYYEINDSNLKWTWEDRIRRVAGINFNTEGGDNYPITRVNPDNPKAYEDICWVRIHEDGHIEKIDVGGPRK